MDLLQSFLLGLIQGLTEFLPISSSGHLALGKQVLGVDVESNLVFEVVVHFGTLCSIVIYYAKTLKELIKASFSWLKHPFYTAEHSSDEKIVQFILISMIPALLVGLFLESTIEEVFGSPVIVSVMLLVTGAILFGTKFVGTNEKRVNYSSSFMIGLAQAFAILPGISRSGSTISLALYLGIKREDAANFSFLMVIPVIAGAMLLKVIELIEVGVSASETAILVVGFLTAFISGYYALKYLIIILKKRGFHYFAYYCWAAGLVSLAVIFF